MFTKMDLEQCQAKNINDVRLDELVDISTIKIDRDRPVVERILSFMEQVKNPYLFKVGNVPVKVTFSENAQTLQKSLEIFLTKNH